jgi:menaquinone reductase, multiheme cytochrome c subunit
MNSANTSPNGAHKSRDKSRGKPAFFLGIAGMLLFGWVVFPFLFYKSVDQPIQFSHKTHTGDNVALTCGDCHTYDSEGRFCGIPSTKECAACHSRPIGISEEEEKLVKDYIGTGTEIPWVIYSRQPENVYFSHATHVKLAGLDCQSCHFGHAYTETLRPARLSRISGYSLDVFGKTLLNAPSTASPGMRMDDCAGCHHMRGIKESCIDCHK